MGFSDDEIQLIQSVWTHVVPGIKDHGQELFIQFFRRNPESQDHFKHFRGKTLEQIRNTRRLKAHGVAVLSMFGQFIEYLDDPEMIDGLAEKLAGSHLDFNIPKSEYDILGDLILEFLQTTLGSDIMTDEASAAWKKVLAAVMDGIDNWTKQLINDDA